MWSHSEFQPLVEIKQRKSLELSLPSSKICVDDWAAKPRNGQRNFFSITDKAVSCLCSSSSSPWSCLERPRRPGLRRTPRFAQTGWDEAARYDNQEATKMDIKYSESTSYYRTYSTSHTHSHADGCTRGNSWVQHQEPSANLPTGRWSALPPEPHCVQMWRQMSGICIKSIYVMAWSWGVCIGVKHGYWKVAAVGTRSLVS